MSKGEIKEYKIDVGIEYPPINDFNDDFEITLPISDEEVEAIINGALRLYWVKDSAETWEYIECFAPKAYKRGNKLAETYCVPKWGDKMKIGNGAYYEFFLPDEIHDKITNDPRWVHHVSILNIRTPLCKYGKRRSTSKTRKSYSSRIWKSWYHVHHRQTIWQYRIILWYQASDTKCSRTAA